MKVCPSFVRPCREGIKWVVFRHGIEDLCPDLADFLSQTGNAGHGVHRVVTSVQHLQNVHSKVAVALASQENPDFDFIASCIEANSPILAGQAADMCKYLAMFGGGTAGTYIKQIVDFNQGLKVKRVLPANHFKLFGTAMKLASAPD